MEKENKRNNNEKVKKEEDDIDSKKVSKNTCYIGFSKKQIARIRDHTDPTKIDIITGKQMQIATVRIPSAAYRSLRFGKDSQAIDRDLREASINLVTSYIFENKDKDTKAFKNYYAYLDPERDYKVNFKGQIIGKDEKTNKNIFDKPEQITLTGAELSTIFKESRVIARKKWLDAQDKKMASGKATSKQKENTDKKIVNKPKETKKTVKKSLPVR